MFVLLLLAPLASMGVPGAAPQPPSSSSVAEVTDYLSELPRAGIPPELFDRPVKPKANLPSLFSTDDYPLQSLVNSEQGTVAVIVRVDPKGRVSDCIIAQSSGHSALDWQTCRLLWTRAQFVPALDRSGKAVESAMRQRIRWQLPPPTPTPIEPWNVRITLDLVEDGGVVSCRMEASGAVEEDEEACAFFLRMSDGHLARLRADAGSKQSRLVFQVQLSRPDSIPIASPPTGMRLFARQVASLTIDENGKPLICRVLQSEGPREISEDCDDFLNDIFEKPPIKVGAIEIVIATTVYIPE